MVLDNTSGSGSFLVAALLEGRNFIGIEKNEDVALFKKHAIDYIQASEQRLQNAWCSMKDELKSKIKVVNLISRFNNETTQNCCSKK